MEELDLDPANYANNGLSRSMEYLEEMRSEIFGFDIGIQAGFANAMYKKYAGREDFARLFLNSDFDVCSWNVTDIGNLAYMALYGHSSVRDEYELRHREILDSIISTLARAVSSVPPQRRTSWLQRCSCM